jgi:hypothetical protein
VEIDQLEKEDWSLDQKNPRTEEHRQIELVKTSNTIREAGIFADLEDDGDLVCG